MNDLSIMFVGIILTALVVMLYRFRFSVRLAVDYFTKTKVGKQALLGIAVFTIAGLLLVGVTANAEPQYLRNGYFPDAKISLGIMTPMGEGSSPFCYEDGIDSRLTSEGRLDITVFRKDRFELTSFYNHNSCALTWDKTTLDSYGFALEWRFDLRTLFTR